MKHRVNLSTILIASFFTGISLYGQDDIVLNLLNQQVEAFNKQDTERLVENISDDFKWFYISADTMLLEVEGKEQFREVMESYFETVKGVHSTIDRYVIDGNRISFKETVKWQSRNCERSQSAMGIYEMKDGKIYRVWYFM